MCKNNVLRCIITNMNNNLLFSDGKKFNDNLDLIVYDFMKKNNYNMAEKNAILWIVFKK